MADSFTADSFQEDEPAAGGDSFAPDPAPAPPPKTTGKMRGGGRVPQIHAVAPGSSPADATEQESAPKEELAPGRAASALLGAGQGASLNYSDELYGKLGQFQELLGHVPGLSGLKPDRTAAQQAVDEDLGEPTLSESMSRAYRNERDSMRRTNAAADDAHPVYFGGGRMAGDLLANTAIAGMTGGASLAPGGQAVVGGVSGLGDSEAELTGLDPSVGGKVEAGKAAFDTGLGAATSYAGAKVGQGLGKYFGKIGARASRGVQEAEQLAEKQGAAAAADETASALGKYGAEAQKASRILENAEREVAIGRVAQANGAAAGPEHAAAVAFLQSPEAQALRAKVLQHNIQQGPGQVGKAGGAKLEWEALQQSEAQRAQEAKDALLAKPVVSNFVKKYAKRATAVGVGALAGYLTGHPSIGTSLGAATAAVMGDPGTATANVLKSPAGRKALWGALELATKTAPEKLGPYAKVLVGAASRGPEALRAMDSALETLPGYLAMKEKLLGTSAAPEEEEQQP